MSRFIVSGGLLLAMTCQSASADPAGAGSLHLADKAQYCYASLFPVYEAYYYRMAGLDEDSSGGACIKLAYKREISASSLAKATRKTFEEQHGLEKVLQYKDGLERIGDSYRDVNPQSGYMYCLKSNEQGVLYHDRKQILQVDDPELAALYLQIWVQEEKDGKPVWTFRDCS